MSAFAPHYVSHHFNDRPQKALVERVPHHTPILLVFQRNFKKALALTNQRKAAHNPKATASWQTGQEEEWERCMEECKQCEAIWIGTGQALGSGR